MPVLLGMASSHAPALFQSTYRGWNRGFEQRLKSKSPLPPEIFMEDQEEIEKRRVPRFTAAFHALKLLSDVAIVAQISLDGGSIR